MGIMFKFVEGIDTKAKEVLEIKNNTWKNLREGMVQSLCKEAEKQLLKDGRAEVASAVWLLPFEIDQLKQLAKDSNLFFKYQDNRYGDGIAYLLFSPYEWGVI